MSAADTYSDGNWIACPHCGKALRDLSDYNWGSRECIETECDHCGKDITLIRNVSVDYRCSVRS